MTHALVLSPSAREDIVDLLEWSIDHFGNGVRDSYEALIETALSAIGDDPLIAGSSDRPEIGEGVRSMHLSVCRDRVGRGVRRILRPRHCIFYRQVGETVFVSRVLHEARSIEQQRFP